MRLPPHKILPPSLFTLSIACSKVESPKVEFKGPHNVYESNGSPIFTVEYALTNFCTN